MQHNIFAALCTCGSGQDVARGHRDVFKRIQFSLGETLRTALLRKWLAEFELGEKTDLNYFAEPGVDTVNNFQVMSKSCWEATWHLNERLIKKLTT